MALFSPLSNKAFMANFLAFLVLFLSNLLITESVGVCYGKLGDNLPAEAEVIELYKGNGINKMRIYFPDSNVFEALRGSDIELILDAPNDSLESLASNPSAAQDWVQNNIKNYYPDVKFKYISAGNEVNPNDPNTGKYAQYVFPAMQNLQKAINDAGLGDQIKVSTATFPALLESPSFPPSSGVFRGDAKDFIKPIIDFLVQNNSPLLVNVYPYFSYIYATNMKIEYALFTLPGIEVQDGSLGYQNLFDAMIDTMYSALEKEGGSNIEIVVSESGWPSENGPAGVSSMENAGTYYRNLIGHVNGGSGTPKKPGRTIETYLFAMFDENKKSGDPSEQHFGLFFPNKQPKYGISFN